MEVLLKFQAPVQVVLEAVEMVAQDLVEVEQTEQQTPAVVEAVDMLALELADQVL